MITIKKFTVKITNDVDGSVCDVVVPNNATIRDVIVGLIKEQFLKSDHKSYLAMQFNLYSLSGIKYNCLDRTIAEYGWQNGDDIIAAPLPYQDVVLSNQDTFSDSIIQEINVKIINGVTGADCDIDVPIDADISDIMNVLYKEGFLVRLPTCFEWVCKYNNSVLGFSDTLASSLNSGDVLLFCCEEYAPNQEISIRVVRGFGGAECVIYVPMNATVGDVIAGLINEGFLDADTPSAPNVLYNSDADSGVKYDDCSITVKEYGWQEGQTIIAVCEEACR